MTQRLARMVARRAHGWSRGSVVRQTALVGLVCTGAAVASWAWWPSGQYRPIRTDQQGTLTGLGRLLASSATSGRPAPVPPPPAAAVVLAPGKHLAVAMIPVGGATKKHPALFVIPGPKGKPAVAILSPSAPDPSAAQTTTVPQATATAALPAPSTTTTATTTSTSPTAAPATAPAPVQATAFPFTLPAPPGPGGTQAVAVNTKNGSVLYDVAYALVTVDKGAPVKNTNSAYALASCKQCTTVAVSFQVVLVVGQSRIVAPIDAAGALNVDCPACTTSAIADQIVVTLKSQPSQTLTAKLQATLKQLDALPKLGANGTPAAVAAQVAAVQEQIETEIDRSGLAAKPMTSSTSATTTAPIASTTAPTATQTTTTRTTTAQTTSTNRTTSTTPATTTSAKTTTSSSTTAPETTTAGTTTQSTTTSPGTSTTAPTTTSPTTTTAATTTTATTTSGG